MIYKIHDNDYNSGASSEWITSDWCSPHQIQVHHRDTLQRKLLTPMHWQDKTDIIISKITRQYSRWTPNDGNGSPQDCFMWASGVAVQCGKQLQQEQSNTLYDHSLSLSLEITLTFYFWKIQCSRFKDPLFIAKTRQLWIGDKYNQNCDNFFWQCFVLPCKFDKMTANLILRTIPISGLCESDLSLNKHESLKHWYW